MYLLLLLSFLYLSPVLDVYSLPCRLAGYLPFDYDDEEDLARSIIKGQPAFNLHPTLWEQVSPLGMCSRCGAAVARLRLYLVIVALKCPF